MSGNRYRGRLQPGPGDAGRPVAADFYIAFGKRAQVLPDDATKETHEVERSGLKTVALGVGYGMQEQSLAVRLAKTCPEARELLQLHRRTFPRFWRWNDDVVQYGKLHRKIWTTYGWELNVTTNQGADDAQLLDASQRERDAQGGLLSVRRGWWSRSRVPVRWSGARRAVGRVRHRGRRRSDRVHPRGHSEASRAVLGGFALGVDLKVWRDPRRFMDEKRGRATWNKIMRHLERAEGGAKSQRFGPERGQNRNGTVGNSPPALFSLYSSIKIYPTIEYTSMPIIPFIEEIEVTNEALAELGFLTVDLSKLHKRQPSDRFVKGPIPFGWLARINVGRQHACHCPSHQSPGGYRGPRAGNRPRHGWSLFKISKYARKRALDALEHAGIIRTERSSGQATRVWLIDKPWVPMTALPLHAIPVIINDQVRLRVYRGRDLEIEMPLRQRQALALAAQLLNHALTANSEQCRSPHARGGGQAERCRR